MAAGNGGGADDLSASSQRPLLWQHLFQFQLAEQREAEYTRLTTVALKDIPAEKYSAIQATVESCRVWRAPTDDPADSFVLGKRKRSPPLVKPPLSIAYSLTRMITAYLTISRTEVVFHSDLVHLAAPFLEVFPEQESDAYSAFSSLMSYLEPLYNPRSSSYIAAEFTMILAHLYPDLYDFLDTEHVDMNKWVHSWLRTLLTQQMPRNSILRLWDQYVKERDSILDLHLYVCLVLVGSISAELQDCEDGERLQTYLSRPNIVARDTLRIVEHARKMRSSLKAQGVV